MKTLKLIFAWLIILTGLSSCKKEHVPQPVNSIPVFYFNGMVNGVSTSLNAGVNNYYMYSSYTQDSNHVYNFIGDLKQTNSNLSSIQVQINDYKVSAVNSNTQPDSSFALTNYSYYSVGVADTSYNVQFDASYSTGTAQTYTWSFGDGSSFTGTSALQSHTYAQAGTYNVCVSVNGSAGTSSICNNVNISSPATAKNVAVSSFSNGNTISFRATPTFTASGYRWYYGDGLDSLYSVDSTTHNYAAAGLYTVSLTVLFNSNTDSITTNYHVATSSYSLAVVNFSLNSVTPVISTGSSLRLSDVIVNWTDANGVLYTSDSPLQPASSTFKILSEEAYQDNINGQATRKLHVNFSCTLYSAGHPSIQITNADAVIAVAYK